MGYRFDADYCEDVVLADGARLRMRAVRAADKLHLAQGLQALSPGSRFSRFFAVKKRFTEDELRYLTELDGVNHYALGVLCVDASGTEREGVAVGRFVRLATDPEVAEPAIVVLDSWQGRGLGRLVLDRLAAAARERDVRRFRAEFLARNVAVQRLFEGLSKELRMSRAGSVIVVDVPLPPADAAPEPPAGSTLPEFLRLAAERLIHLRLRR